MSAPVPVEDPDDPRLADYVGLTDAQLRRSLEERSGIFIAEGDLVVRALVSSPYPVRSVLLAAGRWARLADVLSPLEAPVYVAPQAVLSRVAGFDLHRGVVASATRLPLPDPAALIADATRVLVLEGLTDHENLGAAFRNAAAFGVEAVLLDPTCADPLYRRSVRVSLGHALRVPYSRLAPWPGALGRLQKAGLEVVALTPDGPDTVDGLRPGRALALLVGSEGSGLSAAAMSHADRRVRIPMAAGVDSVNVATAAAIALHRTWRP